MAKATKTQKNKKQAESPKKGRGRPKKQEEDEDPMEVEENEQESTENNSDDGQKKKKASKASSKSKEEDSDDQEEEKQKETKAKKGTEKSSKKTSKDTEESDDEDEKPAPKKATRKGSKKASPKSKEDDSEEEEQQKEDPPKKKKKSSPKAKEDDSDDDQKEEAPKKTRGRAKRSTRVTKSTKEQEKSPKKAVKKPTKRRRSGSSDEESKPPVKLAKTEKKPKRGAQSDEDDEPETLEAARRIMDDYLIFDSDDLKGLTAAERRKKKFLALNWRQMDFIGCESKGNFEMYKEPYEFQEMVEMLTKGELSNKPYPLHAWMTSQPVQLDPTVVDVSNIPVIILIDCSTPPSGLVCQTSIQLGSELLFPVRQKALSWAPFVPRGQEGEILKMKIFPINLLKNEGRAPVVDKMSEEAKHQVSLIMPYEVRPQIHEENTLEKMKADAKSAIYKFKYPPQVPEEIEFSFEKETMRVVIEAQSFAEEHKLTDVDYEDEDSESFKKFTELYKAAIKEGFDKKRAEITEAYEKREEYLKSLGPKKIEGLRNMKIYKFYPTKEGVNMAPFQTDIVNRFYGSADYVYPKYEKTTTVLLGAPAPGQPTGFSLPPASAPTNGGGFSVPPSTGFSLPPSTGSAPSTGFSLPPSTGSAPSTGFSLPPSTGFTAPSTGFTAPSFAAPEFQTTSAPASTGFNFASADLSNNKYTKNLGGAEAGPGEWKCACETINPDSSEVCSLCMMRKQ